MKILFYCPLKSPDDPVPSGDREFARSLQSFFSEQGHDVYLVSRFKARLFYRSPLRMLFYFFELLLVTLRTALYRPDAVFVYHAYYKCPDALGWLMARLFSKPYFIFEASYSQSPRQRAEDKLGYWLHRGALATADRVYTNILGDVPGLQKVLAPEKIKPIAPSLNWQDWERIDILRNKFVAENGNLDIPQVICVAMLRADRKTEGVQFLVNALARLQREGLQFHFQHVGGGPCFDQVKTLCEKNALSFYMWGSLPAEKVREVLSSGSIFAFPGIDEGLGLAFLEAQAAGLPCVAFDTGGIPEVVRDGETGFLTPLMNEDAYVAAIRNLLQNPELATRMGAHARERVRANHDRAKNYSLMLRDMEGFKKV